MSEKNKHCFIRYKTEIMEHLVRIKLTIVISLQD